MADFSIGVILDSFRKPIYETLPIAAKLGAQGFQVYATKGEMSPEEMTAEKRKEFKKLVADNGLVISAPKTSDTDTGTVWVGKYWEDNEDAAGMRPKSVSVTLKRDGTAIRRTDLSAENLWEHTFTQL